MIKKVLVVISLFVLVFVVSTYNADTVNAATKVMWGKTELTFGQIGKATILSDTTLVKLGSNGSLSTVFAH